MALRKFGKPYTGRNYVSDVRVKCGSDITCATVRFLVMLFLQRKYRVLSWCTPYPNTGPLEKFETQRLNAEPRWDATYNGDENALLEAIYKLIEFTVVTEMNVVIFLRIPPNITFQPTSSVYLYFALWERYIIEDQLKRLPQAGDATRAKVQTIMRNIRETIESRFNVGQANIQIWFIGNSMAQNGFRSETEGLA